MIFREVEDRDLIAKATRGGVEAYNLLVTRWEKRVFNYLLRLVGNRDDAFDLTQDTFLKAYQKLGSLADPGRFAPWLFRIAHNEAYSMLRKPKAVASEPADFEPPPQTRGMLPFEVAVAVETAMKRLTEEQREAVVLKVYQGFKFEEMAEVLDCPVSTVKSRLYTAFDLLRETLAPVKAQGA